MILRHSCTLRSRWSNVKDCVNQNCTHAKKICGRICTRNIPDIDDDLLSVHGDARHPLCLLVADVLRDELEDEAEETVEVLRGDHGDVAARRGGVGVVRALAPPGRKVGAHERQ